MILYNNIKKLLSSNAYERISNAKIAGLVSKVPEAIIVTSFQVIKVRMHTKSI